MIRKRQGGGKLEKSKKEKQTGLHREKCPEKGEGNSGK